ncbi:MULTISPECIES: diguanylate cyclase [Aliivibrio]|nr:MULTISPECIES: diguanylate cyclase [Aliivibrio]MBD1570354.1 diguanylate cyclase [Aliivibrio sp. S10_S31]MUH97731.1 diguanylate cyclase [Aliivibrio fischeri]MUI62366.1 diguanylate cyclase [Aliivibrio fischeri]OCH02090.1 diguanylate cyclase [Aliivibrio fischeri]OCH07044.1 diguanylate cyclase [Aliivibrio fischeri]
MKNRSAFFYSSMTIGILLLFLSLFYLFTSYQTDSSRVVERLKFNASFVELWLIKSFSDSDAVLNDMAHDLAESGPSRIEDDPITHQLEQFYLKEKEDALPNATLAFVVDESCALTHSETLRNIDLSEREYCKSLLNNNARQSIITLPFIDLAGRNVVVHGKKIIDDEGKLKGIVCLSTNLNFFSLTLSHLQLPSSMGIAILSTNMKLLSAIPKGNLPLGKGIDLSLVEPSVLERFYRDNEVIMSSDIYENGTLDTIYARKVKDLPFIVVVTKEQNYWQTKFSLSLMLVIGCFTVIIGLLLFNLNYLKKTSAQKDKYTELAYNDYLTGVNNRRAFEEQASKVFKTYQYDKQTFSLVMCDIDNFKEYNDKFGHDVGDQMITAFSEACSAQINQEDIVARLGGDEFIVLLHHKDKEQAVMVAESLQNVIRALSVLVDGQELSMTCSMGVATVSELTTSLHELLNIADTQLYKAKEAGRNCVRFEL